MNKQDRDVLRTILEHKYVNQRILSEKSGYSLGAVNKSMKTLAHEGYLDEDQQLTEKAKQEYDSCVPKNAIILAAGFGMRMVPINLATPKAFLEVNGEPLIERVIGQLHDAGIYDITVVVGFMKETFDYLIDAYGVELVFNKEYAGKNNLHTLSLAADRIGNTYIIPSDIRCESNPFSGHEMYSWYMVSDAADEDSEVRVNRKGELVKVPERSGGNAMIGLSYISVEDAGTLINSIKEADASGAHDEDFWEAALYKGGKMIIPARVVSASDAVDRIVQVFPEGMQTQIRLQLSMVLQAVITQQLLPKKTGGRALACEMMVVTDAIRNLIRNGNTPQIVNAIATSAAIGGQTMDQALVKLVRSGMVSKDVALQYSHDADYVKKNA